MTDYTDWKVLVSVINYEGDDEAQIAAREAAKAEKRNVVEWCNETGQYTVENDGTYYKTVEIPAIPPTDEEIRQMRIAYRREHIDDQTAERSRKQANGTWTDDDETAYLALDAEVTAYIEEHYPYNEE